MTLISEISLLFWKYHSGRITRQMSPCPTDVRFLFQRLAQVFCYKLLDCLFTFGVVHSLGNRLPSLPNRAASIDDNKLVFGLLSDALQLALAFAPPEGIPGGKEAKALKSVFILWPPVRNGPPFWTNSIHSAQWRTQLTQLYSSLNALVIMLHCKGHLSPSQTPLASNHVNCPSIGMNPPLQNNHLKGHVYRRLSEAGDYLYWEHVRLLWDTINTPMLT